MGAEAFGYPPELAAFTSCLVGRDGWTFFGAFGGERLAGVGAVHIQGAAAWLGFAATRKELRGRGAQSALIAARLVAAKKAACRWACVETAADTTEKPNPSTHNLRRLGFADAYERPNWVKVLREK
jgi:GNAT superfamily N-acetyltransferase